MIKVYKSRIFARCVWGKLIYFLRDIFKNLLVVSYQDLDVCKVCLKKQEGVLYKYNIKHVKILDLAFQSSIDFEKWDDASNFGRALISVY